MKRSFVFLLILFCAPLLLAAQSVWEGSCAVGAYSSFPSSGLYGASNSFPQNTLVTVKNLDTNKKATVLIIDRLNDGGLFMLLSKDAGNAIGLPLGQVSQVRVTLAKQASTLTQGPGDLPYSPDSDIFPAASVGNPTSLSFLDQYLKGAEKGTASQPTSSMPVAPAAPAPSAAALPAAPSPAAPSSAAPEVAQRESTAPAPAEVAQPAQVQPTPKKPTPEQPTEPSVSPLGGSVPTVVGLESAVAPAAVLPALSVVALPRVPAKPGSGAVVTELHAAAAPSAAAGLAEAEQPPLPEIRTAAPAVTAVVSATPPQSPLPEVSLATPREPAGRPGGPQVTQLAEVEPQAPPAETEPSVVPPVPSRAEATAGRVGPQVSALAQAQPPQMGVELARAEMPLPSTPSLAPEVTRLAEGQPPAPQPREAQVTPQPTPQAPQAQATPQPTPPTTEAQKPSAPAPTVAAAETAGRVPVRPSSALEAASYYVQLGVYGKASAALALADNLSPDYPVSVYAFKRDQKPLYKVMIGPLNSDESGTLLYLFTARGYTGAFVRKGE